ncbi:DUF2274 domain-containing protein [Algimonas porphyrae]|uniref:DUF2274 domain-containing protein n=1 Tax=Algimonas porphyrae TaxID=1128113 RepID=A0ABQ5UZS1_9PROT|nr:DUF2274 domain-containing protein [Algimonas porphyrae]GLQ19477.1 hypothetical protein GCM10007854_04320 [Algimonas porphyrae]
MAVTQNVPALRIGKLPDLTPVKMTIQLAPEIYRALVDYARIYENRYGENVAPATLVPTMLATFMASDAGFKRTRKTLEDATGSA